MRGQMFTIVGINPEPWAVGTANAGRRGGQIRAGLSPNQKMQTYQAALKDEARELLAHMTLNMFTGPMKIRFWFWRQIEVGHAGVTRKQQSGHIADATNLQKSTEDALQGLLYYNDRETRDIRSVIVEQGYDIEPCIVVHIEPYIGVEDTLSIQAADARQFELARMNAEPSRSADAPDVSPWS